MAKILVVDGDQGTVDAVRLHLEKEGYKISSCSTRQEGMKAVAEIEPDLLILDVMLREPDDGMVMARELRRQGFTRPIFMLSSIGKVTGMSFGRDDELIPVDEFQEKPVDPATLVAKVKELLSQ